MTPLDALAGADLRQKAESVGAAKASAPLARTFVLAMLAGAFIGLGATFMLVVKADSSLGFAASQLLGGLAFSLGLMLVVGGGAELFTGNSLMVMGCLAGKYAPSRLLKSWLVVYLGNFAGSLLLVALMVGANVQGLAGGGMAAAIVSVAAAKVGLAPATAFFRGILCNVLVCLAVWIGFSARSVADKLAAVVLPVAAFVAMGFEHCVANMYFLPLAAATVAQGLAPDAALAASITPAAIAGNLVFVTLGNIVGGALLVGVAYWFAYGGKIEGR